MCIVAIKLGGVQRPTDTQLQEMCLRNHDGFGYVTYNGKKLQVYKTMDSQDYIERVKQIPDSQPVIYHCRIATHGSVQQKNCHPFLSKDKKWAFAHNGVLTIQNEGDMTDSETFFKRLALPLIKAGHKPNDGGVFDRMVACVIGSSKFAFMDNKGNIYHYGNYIEDGGVLYSNSSYKPMAWNTWGGYKCDDKNGWTVSDKQGDTPSPTWWDYTDDDWNGMDGDDFEMLINEIAQDMLYDEEFFNVGLNEHYDHYKRYYIGLSYTDFSDAYSFALDEIDTVKKSYIDNEQQ